MFRIQRQVLTSPSSVSVTGSVCVIVVPSYSWGGPPLNPYSPTHTPDGPSTAGPPPSLIGGGLVDEESPGCGHRDAA